MTRKMTLATFALLIANFMGGLDATIVNTALPAITSDLNSIRLIGWISSIFLLGTAVTTILWGRISEIIGKKIAFQISISLFIISSLVGGLSFNMPMLIIARAFMGIGAGGMISIPFIIYADLYPNPSQQAKALVWVTASYTLSTIAGPIIGGWLVDTFSWHWVFFINLPIGTISILISALAMIIATKNSPYWWLLVSGAFKGFGMGIAFTPMQVSLQDGVRIDLVGISTTFGLLFRTLGQTFMAAVFGAILSISTRNQVSGKITSEMINQLTNATSVKKLPQELLPQLHTILFNGLHSIMMIGFILVIIALILNITRKEPIKQPR